MSLKHRYVFLVAATVVVAMCRSSSAQFVLVKGGIASCEIVVDATNAKGEQVATLQDAGDWLADCVRQASDAEIGVVRQTGELPSVVIGRADAHPEAAATAGLKSRAYDAFCIVTARDRLHILGNSEAAARHGVATLLHYLGFRWFAPSRKWHIVPSMKDIAVKLDMVDEPRLAHRGIWYAYAGGEKQLMDDYRRWAIANRLSVSSVIRTGHSYGNIISRNKDEFDKHPEYFALLADGRRDNERPINARKFCFSNPGLIDLVTRDRIRLLEEYRRANPAAYMVSVDPSDGEGTCHCENCQKLGTTTDRALHLANQVARRLRDKCPGGWVGLYAYSSHRLPPTIDVERNVYAQVAMGFNRTQYSLAELVELWSKKVGAIGLREYYGVEAWDWGLPGRMRGGHVEYHQRWIPYYAERKLNAINAETNANWGGQMLGLYVASQLMWDPDADAEALVDDFFEKCYGPSSRDHMQLLRGLFDHAPPLRAATLVPMFDELLNAWRGAEGEWAERSRIVDMMAYLVYVAKFREFDLVRSSRPSRGDDYYDALLPLMQYAWQIRMRDVVHYYALARRLCNGLPVQDKRLDFYMFHKEQSPVWMTGEQITDEQIKSLFLKYRERLRADGDPVVSYSLDLRRVHPPGDDAGASRQFLQNEDGVATFRSGLAGYVVVGGKQTVRMGIAPTSHSASIVVYASKADILFDRTYDRSDEFQTAEFELPKANTYRVEFDGGFKLRVPAKTPFVFEASAWDAAWIDYSGPHYFYVPKGTKKLIVDASPRLSVYVPGRKKRVDISAASRQTGKDYAAITVPPDAAGRVWHTSNQTRGQVTLMNVPPLLSFHRQSIFVPREVAEADGLNTK